MFQGRTQTRLGSSGIYIYQFTFILYACVILTGCIQQSDTQSPNKSSMNTSQLIQDEIQLNQIPEIISIPVTSSNYNEAYFYPAQAIDPDGDELTWGLMTAPIGLKIDEQAGLLYGSGISPGSHTVTLKVDDGNSGSSEQTFTLTIKESPTVYSIAPNYTFSGAPYRYQVAAAAPDGTTLIHTLERGPSGMSIAADSGSLEWGLPVLGEHEVVINVTSASGNTATQAYALTVLDEDSLTVISKPVTTAYESQPYSYKLSVLSLTEADKTFSLTKGVAGMGLDATSGQISWVPDTAGLFMIEVSVLDTEGRTGSQAFELWVRSSQEMDLVFNGVIQNAFDNLVAGDIESAKTFLSGEAQANYLPVLNALLPNMEEIVANLGEMERVSIDNTSAEYIIPRTLNGETRLFIVTFVPDPEGNWRLNSL